MSCLGAEFVVAAADVLYERVAADDDARGAVGLEAAHRSQRRFQPSVVAFDPVVRVLPGVVHRAGNQFRDDARQRGGAIGHDLVWEIVREHGVREEGRAAAMSRHFETNTSMTWPCWSTAR